MTGQTSELSTDPLLVALEQTHLVPSSTQVHLERLGRAIERRVVFDVLPGALMNPGGFTLNVQAVAGRELACDFALKPWCPPSLLNQQRR